jgi:L-ribulose-5-phosphate 4-epimerase
MNYQDIREECCAANKSLPSYGLVDLTFGNVSCLDRQQGVFAIKPSGVDFPQLTPEDMVVVDLEGKKVDGRYRPSSDTETHRRLFLAFENIRAVVHSHSRHAVAFAQAKRGIPCFGTTHADYFHGEIPVTREMTPDEIARGYEWETGNVIVERFTGLRADEMPGVLVSSHGPFTWGESATQAVEHAVALEIIAQAALVSLALNPTLQPISTAMLDKHFKRKHGPGRYYGQPSASS